VRKVRGIVRNVRKGQERSGKVRKVMGDQDRSGKDRKGQERT
jgi:hypothetical protein